ncbi:MAG: hypothetical protein AB7P37_03375 [Ramlibacter sp.]
MMRRRTTLLGMALAPLAGLLPPTLALARPGQTVTDYVTMRGAAAVFADVRKLATEDSGWLFVSRQWTTPAEIVPACARLGWVTVGQVDQVAQLIGQVDYRTIHTATARTALPSFTVQGVPTITASDMHMGCIVPAARATANCGIAPGHAAVPTDGVKHLLTASQWDELLEAFPGGADVAEFEYGKRECEEFAFDLYSWLGTVGMGTASHGIAWLQMFSNGAKLRSGHVTNICVTQDRRVWWLDAIDRKRHPLSFVAFRGYRGVYSDGAIEATADASLIQTLVL